MLKAVVTVTSLGLLIIYVLLLTIAYPRVCWLKHRPTDIETFTARSHTHLHRQRPASSCSAVSRLNLMPMPSTVQMINTTNLVQLPSQIRIESKRVLPQSMLSSSQDASFTLVVDFSASSDEHVYPELGIDESYQLNITSGQHASLFARTSVGIVRGLATFVQLQHQSNIPVPLFISDRPQFPWRGLMVDVARHFIPMSVIRRLIDDMQYVKMNVLHLHLSDDQGFRLESRVHPRLHDPHDFYSQADMRLLVEYARQRAIRIVPEFDVPAHTTSWFVGYPSLAAARKPLFQVEQNWGVMNGTMDVTLETTYDFLDRFFRELVDLFPDAFVHIGGDECQPNEWLESASIRKFIQDKQMNNHHGLQAYFNERIEKMLNKYNRE
jgi:hexosaminidase